MEKALRRRIGEATVEAICDESGQWTIAVNNAHYIGGKLDEMTRRIALEGFLEELSVLRGYVYYEALGHSRPGDFVGEDTMPGWGPQHKYN